MKIIRLLAFSLFGLACLSSCRKSEGPPPYGKLTVSFANEVDGQPLTLGPKNYKTPAGNTYGVDMLKYFISNLTLVKADGSEKNFGTHKLIDASKPESLSFTLDSVLNGEYTSVKFLLGVDSQHNHTGNQEGDLDPGKGMIWTWDVGYTFFKSEGNFRNKSGATQPYLFHYGTDDALVPVTLPVSKLIVSGDAHKLYLKFNLNSAYGTPYNINFDDDNNRMSDPSDGLWIGTMNNNFRDAFQFDRAE